MATKEIPNREAELSSPEFDRELIVQEEPARLMRDRMVARLNVLWDKRRFLGRCTLIGFAASILIVLLIPVRYTSITRLMPPEQGNSSGIAAMLASVTAGGGAGALGALGGDLLGLKTSGDLFLGVLHSRSIQDALVAKFDLRKVYGTGSWESARKQLEQRTDVTADRKSGIITISVQDHDRQRVAALAAEYVAQLDRVVTTMNNSSAHKERVFLERRLVQVNQDLEDSEWDFSKFASKNTAIDIKEQGKSMIEAAALVEGQLIAAQTELQSLRQLYTENNVRVRATQARVDELRRQLQKLGGSARPTPDSATDTGAPTEAGAPEDHPPTIRELPGLGVPYADLLRRVKVQEALFETLTKEYELAKIDEAKESLSVKILDPADVPERKSFPPRTILVFLFTMLTFAGAVVWVALESRWHHIDPHDPGKLLAQEVLGTINSKWPWRSRSRN
ncbi:MAG TPA: lipopolysaccharide biosynthesis protein [Candidatus Sulfotelmatobacter sp.]